MFYKKMFVKITGKYLCWRLLLNKLSGLLQDSYFLVNFAKILRTLFLLKISGGWSFQMLPNLKRRKNDSKMNRKNKVKHQLETTLIIPNIKGRKYVNVIGKDLVS